MTSSVIRKLRRAFSGAYLLLNVRGQNNTHQPIFGSGPFVRGLCVETGQLFEILKQTLDSLLSLLQVW